MQRYTKVELEMMIDDIKHSLEYQMQLIPLQAKIHKERYDSLLKEGFTKEEAMDIVKARPMMDI
ncbi:hypothetical protein E2329_22540 [Salmonella enterica subsp. enterica]|nr:hypothetical protein [Salmonella enterica subsp. enterica serovar Paratyphi A]